MPYITALQMDPIESIHPGKDNTYLLGLEAQRRGHAVKVYTPERLQMRDGRVFATVCDAQLTPDAPAHVHLSAPYLWDLAEADFILLRQDTPVTMGYIYSTYILDLLADRVTIINHPRGVRDVGDKLWAQRFPGLMPPTLVTRERVALRAFLEEHGEVVLKPTSFSGGTGITRLRAADGNLDALLDLHFRLSPEPVVIQRFLPEIATAGDKRIIVLDGAPMAAAVRRPQAGDHRANMVRGGTVERAELTARDRDIVHTLAPHFQDMGLAFVGVDVIGDFLTEVNPHSPTLMGMINTLEQRTGDARLERIFWRNAEARRPRPNA